MDAGVILARSASAPGGVPEQDWTRFQPFEFKVIISNAALAEQDC